MDIEQETAILKRDVKQALTQQGVMEKMKAQMREYVLRVLRKEGCGGLTSTKSKQIAETESGRIEYSIVRSYLQDNDLKYTTSVMDGEAGFEDSSPPPAEPELPSKAMLRLQSISKGKKTNLLSVILNDWLSMVEAGGPTSPSSDRGADKQQQVPLSPSSQSDAYSADSSTEGPTEIPKPATVDNAAPAAVPAAAAAADAADEDPADSEYSSITKDESSEGIVDESEASYQDSSSAPASSDIRQTIDLPAANGMLPASISSKETKGDESPAADTSFSPNSRQVIGGTAGQTPDCGFTGDILTDDIDEDGPTVRQGNDSDDNCESFHDSSDGMEDPIIKKFDPSAITSSDNDDDDDDDGDAF
eukprot:TRINITY_DN6731_c0_g1_i1.p1 TRINITY_DN6731_c0_g1~~TRINITY_DN6731_c0_g1_i1.p1  ORF type:complete len:361 (+),score=108.82 TRINITY_DN6731_c0_g1_i1:48-1130(+)